MKALSILGYLLMVAGLLGLFAVDSILATGAAGIAAQVAAAALMIWARVTFGFRSFHATANPTEGRLVTTGPYAFVRHPIYTAIGLFAIAAAASHPSWIAAGCVLLVAAGAGVRIALEERMLRERYPGYAAYAARVKRVIPGVF